MSSRADSPEVLPWRVGRSLGRTVYWNDQYQGIFDSRAVAQRVVDLMNAAGQVSSEASPMPRRYVYAVRDTVIDSIIAEYGEDLTGADSYALKAAMARAYDAGFGREHGSETPPTCEEHATSKTSGETGAGELASAQPSPHTPAVEPEEAGNFNTDMLCRECSAKWIDWMEEDPELGKRRESAPDRWRVGRHAKVTIWWGEDTFHGSVRTPAIAERIVEAMNEIGPLQKVAEAAEAWMGAHLFESGEATAGAELIAAIKDWQRSAKAKGGA